MLKMFKLCAIEKETFFHLAVSSLSNALFCLKEKISNCFTDYRELSKVLFNKKFPAKSENLSQFLS